MVGGGGGSSTGKAVKLILIQFKVESLCIPLHLPKPSSWSVFRVDSGPRALCLIPLCLDSWHL